MKRRLNLSVLLGLIFFIFIGFTSCTAPKENNENEAGEINDVSEPSEVEVIKDTPKMSTAEMVVVPEGGVIHLAIVLAFTGDIALEYGVGAPDALAVYMAIDDYGPIYGHHYQVMEYDEKCTEEGGIEAGNEVLSDIENLAVIGHNCSNSFMSILEAYEENRLLVISGSASQALHDLAPSTFNRTILNSEVYSDGGDFFWEINPTTLDSYENWVEDYMGRYEYEPSEYSAFFYDATMVLLSKIEEVSTVSGDTLLINREALISGVRNTWGHQGVTGCISFDENGDRINDVDSDFNGVQDNCEPVALAPDPPPEIADCYFLVVNAKNGSVNTSPSPNCPEGDVYYLPGTEVSLSANANSGYEFNRWSGFLSGINNPGVLTMDQNKTVTAEFERNQGTEKNEEVICYEVFGLIIGDGGYSHSIGFNCPSGEYSYSAGTEISFTPDPYPGWVFDHWEGDCSVSGEICVLVMNSDQNTTAYFEPVEVTCYDLDIQTSIHGSISYGYVYDGNNNCSGGQPGVITLPEGAIVTLTATPFSGYQFDRWEGACSGQGTVCTFTLNSNQSTTIIFVPLE